MSGVRVLDCVACSEGLKFCGLFFALCNYCLENRVIGKGVVVI